jgi:hypothetical protein
MTYSAIGSVPYLLPILGSLGIETHQESGLRAVSESARPAAIAAFQTQGVLGITNAQPDSDKILATWQVGITAGDQWVDRAVADGYMVLIRTDTLAQGTVPVMITKSAETIAASATQAGGWVMLAGAEGLAVAAVKVAMASKCPGGQAWAPAKSACVPIPGGDQPPAPPQPGKSGVPSWALPAAVVAGILLLTAAVAAKG